jgi:hypothetical protein
MAKTAHAKIAPKMKVGLVFCEDENDAEALRNIAKAIRPGLPSITYCRKPLVLIRNRKDAEARKKNAAQVAAVVKARQQLCDVKFVVAHQDCDELEPAHKALVAEIEKELKAQGLTEVIPVAPAWEIEAWWYLWPGAVASVNSKWRPLTRKGNHGMLTNVKEQLRRDLRAPETRDYEESDSRSISRSVLTMGVIGSKQGSSSSFEDFRTRVLALKL